MHRRADLVVSAGALVDDHGAYVNDAGVGEADELAAPGPTGIPLRRERHHEVIIAVELTVARRRPAASLSLLEAVHRHRRRDVLSKFKLAFCDSGAPRDGARHLQKK